VEYSPFWRRKERRIRYTITVGAVTSFLLLFLLCQCDYGQSRFPGQPDRLGVGIGDRLSWRKGGQEVYWHEKAKQDGVVVDYIEIWLTRDWEESWISRQDLERVINEGLRPVIMHYYFADDISREYVESHIDEWYADLARLASQIDIDREIWVVLEPEFNDVPSSGTPITQWEGWNDAVIGAAEIIRAGAPEAKVSICPGDFQQLDLELCLRRAAAELDFLSFQELRASTYYEPSSPGRLNVIDSAVRFSKYMRDTFRRPVFLAYLGISTYKDGDPLGWEDEQAMVVKALFNRSHELLANGVFGLVYFEYYDDPLHSGFFGEAEKYFGLMDKDGEPKAAWHIWREKSRRVSRTDEGRLTGAQRSTSG
jgi:hypothetical protein